MKKEKMEEQRMKLAKKKQAKPRDNIRNRISIAGIPPATHNVPGDRQRKLSREANKKGIKR